MALLSYRIVVRHEDNVRCECSTHFLLKNIGFWELSDKWGR